MFFNIFLLILLPVFSIAVVLIIPKSEFYLLRFFTIFLSFSIFILSVILLIFFDKGCTFYQYVGTVYFFYHDILFGVDGMSLLLIILSSFLIPLCFLANWNNSLYFKELAICLFSIEFFLFLIFSVLDVLLFYVFFESVLINAYG